MANPFLSVFFVVFFPTANYFVHFSTSAETSENVV